MKNQNNLKCKEEEVNELKTNSKVQDTILKDTLSLNSTFENQNI